MSRNHRRLPPLSTLRAFEAAARHGSMVGAAGELHVTHGAVSRQVRALEQDLGEPLFERRNRGIHLNERGRLLSGQLSEMFLDLERMFGDFRSRRRPPPLIVSCEPTLALKRLIPAVADLRRDTGLDVRVLAAGGPVDFARDRVDIAIRRNDFPLDPKLFAVDLADEWMGPVMAPGLAEALSRGAVEMIHADTRPHAWRDWTRRSGVMVGTADGGARYEHFFLAIQAAEAMQGMAMASVHMVADDLASGRLAAPYGFLRDGTKYLALSATRFDLDARKRLFTDWMAVRLDASAQGALLHDAG